MIYRGGFNYETLHAFDLGADRELWSIEMPDLATGAVAAAGEHIVLANTDVISIYEVDGTKVGDIMALSDQVSLAYMAVSPDGNLVAISVSRMLDPTPTPLPIGVAGPGREPDDLIVIYDIAQRRQILTFDRAQPQFEEVVGMFGPLQWRDDGSGVLLWVAANSEAAGPYLTLYLDGTTVRHNYEGWAWVAPSSRRMAEGFGSLGCMFISGHDVVLRNLDSGAVLLELHDESRAFTGFDWSPDNAEFLVESRPYDESFDCEDRWWAEEPAYVLMDTTTGRITEVSDLEGLMRRWYQSELFWVECGGDFVPLRPSPFGNLRAWGCSGPGRLYVDDQEISSGDAFWVVGLIE